MEQSKQYYSLALERDTALIENTLQRMRRLRNDKAILVTGGFHTQGITNILREKGISYVVICPNICQGDYDAIYNDRIAGKLPSIEQIEAALSDTLVAPLPTGDASKTASSGAQRLFEKILTPADKVSLVNIDAWLNTNPDKAGDYKEYLIKKISEYQHLVMELKLLVPGIVGINDLLDVKIDDDLIKEKPGLFLYNEARNQVSELRAAIALIKTILSEEHPEKYDSSSALTSQLFQAIYLHPIVSKNRTRIFTQWRNTHNITGPNMFDEGLVAMRVRHALAGPQTVTDSTNEFNVILDKILDMSSNPCHREISSYANGHRNGVILEVDAYVRRSFSEDVGAWLNPFTGLLQAGGVGSVAYESEIEPSKYQIKKHIPSLHNESDEHFARFDLSTANPMLLVENQAIADILRQGLNNLRIDIPVVLQAPVKAEKEASTTKPASAGAEETARASSAGFDKLMQKSDMVGGESVKFRVARVRDLLFFTFTAPGYDKPVEITVPRNPKDAHGISLDVLPNSDKHGIMFCPEDVIYHTKIRDTSRNKYYLWDGPVLIGHGATGIDGRLEMEGSGIPVEVVLGILHTMGVNRILLSVCNDENKGTVQAPDGMEVIYGTVGTTWRGGAVIDTHGLVNLGLITSPRWSDSVESLREIDEDFSNVIPLDFKEARNFLKAFPVLNIDDVIEQKRQLILRAVQMIRDWVLAKQWRSDWAEIINVSLGYHLFLASFEKYDVWNAYTHRWSNEPQGFYRTLDGWVINAYPEALDLPEGSVLRNYISGGVFLAREEDIFGEIKRNNNMPSDSSVVRHKAVVRELREKMLGDSWIEPKLDNKGNFVSDEEEIRVANADHRLMRLMLADIVNAPHKGVSRELFLHGSSGLLEYLDKLNLTQAQEDAITEEINIEQEKTKVDKPASAGKSVLYNHTEKPVKKGNPPALVAEFLKGTRAERDGWYTWFVEADIDQIDPFFVKIAKLEGKEEVIYGGGSDLVQILLGEPKAILADKEAEVNIIMDADKYAGVLFSIHDNVDFPEWKINGRERRQALKGVSVVINGESSNDLRDYINNYENGRHLVTGHPEINVPLKHVGLLVVPVNGNARIYFRTEKDCEDYINKVLTLPDADRFYNDPEALDTWIDQNRDAAEGVIDYCMVIYARSKMEDLGWQFDDNSMWQIRKITEKLTAVERDNLRDSVIYKMEKTHDSKDRIPQILDAVINEFFVAGGRAFSAGTITNEQAEKAIQSHADSAKHVLSEECKITARFGKRPEYGVLIGASTLANRKSIRELLNQIMAIKIYKGGGVGEDSQFKIGIIVKSPEDQSRAEKLLQEWGLSKQVELVPDKEVENWVNETYRNVPVAIIPGSDITNIDQIILNRLGKKNSPLVFWINQKDPSYGFMVSGSKYALELSLAVALKEIMDHDSTKRAVEALVDPSEKIKYLIRELPAIDSSQFAQKAEEFYRISESLATQA
jgi:hypothetical protein